MFDQLVWDLMVAIAAANFLIWGLFIVAGLVCGLVITFGPLLERLFGPSKAERARAEAILRAEVGRVGWHGPTMQKRRSRGEPYLDQKGGFHW